MSRSTNSWMIFDEVTATAGTASAFGTAERVSAILVVAKPGNTGTIYIGGSDVDNSVNDGLAPGDNVRFEHPVPGRKVDVSDFYIDVDTTGEGADLYFFK